MQQEAKKEIFWTEFRPAGSFQNMREGQPEEVSISMAMGFEKSEDGTPRFSALQVNLASCMGERRSAAISVDTASGDGFFADIPNPSDDGTISQTRYVLMEIRDITASESEHRFNLMVRKPNMQILSEIPVTMATPELAALRRFTAPIGRAR